MAGGVYTSVVVEVLGFFVFVVVVFSSAPEFPESEPVPYSHDPSRTPWLVSGSKKEYRPVVKSRSPDAQFMHYCKFNTLGLYGLGKDAHLIHNLGLRGFAVDRNRDCLKAMSAIVPILLQGGQFLVKERRV